MGNELFQPNSYIDSEERAMLGASKENSVRDLADGIDTTDAEKEALISVAEKQAEKVMQEYDVEKEKSPVERLTNLLNNIVAKMEDLGLEKDSEIVFKIQNRINRYVGAVRKYIQEYEAKTNTRLTVDNLLENYDNQYARHFTKISKSIPIAHKINDHGGQIYEPSGKQNEWFPDLNLISKDRVEVMEANGKEFINFSFSDKGATEFCRQMGILGGNEEFLDITNIYEKLSKSPVDSLNYEIKFPTNIDGVSLNIKHDSTVRYNHASSLEKSVTMEFSDEFLKKLLS